MEFNQLRYFLAVAKHGSFSKAAKTCFISQPALSEQIQKLEREVGKRLFDRSHRKIVLTAEGKLLAEKASGILEAVNEAKLQIQGTTEVASGSITLGVLSTVEHCFVPQLLRKFNQACPLVRITIHEDSKSSLVAMVQAGELDLAIASLPVGENHFEMEPLFTEEWLLALPSRHRLASKPKILMNDLCEEKFIMMKEAHPFNDELLSFCRNHDCHPQVVLRSGQIERILSLINSELGISLVPHWATASGVNSIVYRSLGDTLATLSIVAFWRKKRSQNKAFQELRKHLRQTAQVFAGNGAKVKSES